MATDDLEGRRVRLRPDAPIGSYVLSCLTDDQHRDGIEGVILRAATEDSRLVYDVKLENVPRPHRVAADHCDLLADGRGLKMWLLRRR